MTLSGIIQSPHLWPANPGKERRVTWMELFFDLIFVAAVAQVGTSLGVEYSLPGLLRYSFLFVLIWLAWSGHTLYSTRFDSDDLAQSFIAAVMAANATTAPKRPASEPPMRAGCITVFGNLFNLDGDH